MNQPGTKESKQGIALFRAKDAPGLMESGTMTPPVLEAGDGFFVPSGAPYAYEAGPDGVTVLEFRTRTTFGMDIPGGQLERLRRMAVVADEHADEWVERRAQITF